MKTMCGMAAVVGVVAALLRAAPGAGWVVEDIHDGIGGWIETAVLEGRLAVLEARPAQIQMWRRAAEEMGAPRSEPGEGPRKETSPWAFVQSASPGKLAIITGEGAAGDVIMLSGTVDMLGVGKWRGT